jgi:hypothetical protein
MTAEEQYAAYMAGQADARQSNDEDWRELWEFLRLRIDEASIQATSTFEYERVCLKIMEMRRSPAQASE